MDISSLLDTAKSQLDKIKAQIASTGISGALKSELVQNQAALQQAYDSLLSQAGIIDDATKQQLTDALASAKKSSLAATADANKKTLLWMGGAIVGIIIISIVARKLFKKHNST
jgi:multidrug efflux pump subunit AcrA (membrane-fusion protein)